MYRLTCFGEVSILGPDSQVIRLRSRKHIALLTYLAANRRRAHDRDTLASLLWKTPIDRARHSLSQALYDIKTKLNGSVLSSTTSRVRFADNHLIYDGHALEEAVRKEHFAAAVELYEGGFAPGLDAVATRDFERWVEDERRRLDELARIALRNQAEISYSEGRWSEMFIAARKLVVLDPLDESAHRAVIQALWLHGDQQGALRHFDALVDMLRTELDAEPNEATLALARRIRTPRTTAARARENARSELPLIGRRQEFAALQEAAEGARRPEARLVYVDGEAGIGKTRLVREFTRSASLAGIRVLNSRCYSAESDAAYLPVLEGIRGIVADLAATETSQEGRYHQLGHLFPEYPALLARTEERTSEPEVNRRRMYEEVADVMRRSFGPRTLWIIEDIHWIDASSASLLHYLLRRLRKRPLLLVMTARRHIDLTKAARKLLDDARANLHCDEVRLGPLASEEIDALIRSGDKNVDATVLDAVRRYSGGNPFYALEIARSLTQERRSQPHLYAGTPITPQLRDLLAARLDGIDREAVRILEAVAVLDRYATPRLVAEMSGLTLSGAAEAGVPLYRRHLLEDTDAVLAFPHDIVREYVYDALGSLKTTALHLRAGELLADDSAANPALVARHFANGGEKQKAYDFALRAAQESAARSAHEEALRMAELAADCALGEQRRVLPLKIVARSCLALAHYQAAAAAAQELLGLDSVEQPEERAQLFLIAGRSLSHSAPEQARSLLEKAAVAAGSIERLPGRYESLLEVLHWNLRFAWTHEDKVMGGRSFAQIGAAMNEAASLGQLTAALEGSAVSSLAAFTTFYESSQKAHRLISGALDSLAQLPPELQLRVLKIAGVISIRVGSSIEAEALFKRALRIAHELNDINEIATLWNNIAAAVHDRADWTQIDRIAAHVKSLEQTLPEGLLVSDSIRANLADAYFFRGMYDDAEGEVEDALKLTTSTSCRSRRAGLTSMQGLIQLCRGQVAAATKTWHTINESESVAWAGEPHRYKIEWLEAMMREDKTRAAQGLAKAASEEYPLEYSNYLKLSWLQVILNRPNQQLTQHGRTIEKKLREFGLGWFVHFTRRWMKAVEGL
jgi:DNA-binding SARP family transcriptional activator/tetratricopeptide (TPR) repeat protein